MKGLYICLVLLSFATAAIAADDPLLGSYQLNVDKSTSSGMPLPAAATLVVSEDGDDLVLTVSAKNADGSTLDESTSMPKGGGALRRNDGGTLRYDSVAATRPNQNTIEMVMMQGDREALRLTYTLDPDQRVLTRAASGTNSRGQRVNAVFVFERR